jgi:hypothetical protein
LPTLPAWLLIYPIDFTSLQDTESSNLIFYVSLFIFFNFKKTLPMSKKREIIRKYNLTDAELKQTADQLLALIDRDAVAFADRNFTATKRAEFKTAILDFDNIPSDDILEGQKMTTTEDKNNLRDILTQKMRTAILMAKLVFGANSGKYRSFGDINYAEQTDAELYKNAKTIILAATLHLNELAAEGMTTTRIQELEDTKNAFDEALDKQAAAINSRDIATSERVEAGNALYGFITKYAEIGKDIWYAVNEAHYNDYIIYESTQPTQGTNNSPTDSNNDNTTV